MSALYLAIGTVAAGALEAGGTAIAGNQAAKATEGATNAAINQQNQALAQQTALEAPYVGIGTGTQGNPGAIQLYNNLLGLGKEGTAGVESSLASTPGYQFAKTQGTTNTVNQASAMGLGLSGNTLQGLDTFTTGLADSTYQSVLGDVQGAVGIGQAAASGQAANVGNAANNVSSLISQQGANTAGINANTIAGISKAVGNTGTNLAELNTLQNLVNPGVPFSLDSYALPSGGPALPTIGGP